MRGKRVILPDDRGFNQPSDAGIVGGCITYMGSGHWISVNVDDSNGPGSWGHI